VETVICLLSLPVLFVLGLIAAVIIEYKGKDMATWTKMKVNNMVQIEWGDAFKKTVRCKTVYGEMLESVDRLREKVKDRYLLTPIRKIYQDMLDFAQGNAPDEKHDRRKDDK